MAVRSISAHQEATERVSGPLKWCHEVTGLGMTGLREAVASGELKHFKQGRKIFVTREALMAFVRNREATASAQVGA